MRLEDRFPEFNLVLDLFVLMQTSRTSLAAVAKTEEVEKGKTEKGDAFGIRGRYRWLHGDGFLNLAWS